MHISQTFTNRQLKPQIEIVENFEYMYRNIHIKTIKFYEIIHGMLVVIHMSIIQG